MLDLDGVVYIGEQAVPGAALAISAARQEGMRVAFITNNAARPADVVAAHLQELGIPAAPADVVTSAQAAARLAAERFGSGARILCLGGPGLRQALSESGLVPVDGEEQAAGVVSGYGPDLPWRAIMQAAVRIKGGLPWIASNTDHTIPTAFGVAPGHGVLVQMLREFAGVTPQVAGKPERPLLDETIRRVGGTRPLMVGDRLDTDIEGARNAGVDSLLVMTGVTGLAELAGAAPGSRPNFIADDLAGLLSAHAAPSEVDGGWEGDGWRAVVRDEALTVTGSGGTRSGWWQVAAAAAWAHHDATGAVPDLSGLAR